MSEAFEKCVSGAAAGRPVGIALFVEEGGGDWHARQLKAAMEARGAEVVITTLKACAFDTRLPSGIDIPGFKDQLPDGAFVRSISTGSLEQITLRLGILHALRESGVTVWNDARAIERCVDKSTATFFFQKAGLPVPVTRTAEGIESARRFLEDQAATCVGKPLFGSQGNGGSTRTLTSPTLMTSAMSITPSATCVAAMSAASRTGACLSRAAGCSQPWPGSVTNG
jgi:tetrahydromethanopterin:alpha-L-glutamate ligase